MHSPVLSLNTTSVSSAPVLKNSFSGIIVTLEDTTTFLICSTQSSSCASHSPAPDMVNTPSSSNVQVTELLNCPVASTPVSACCSTYVFSTSACVAYTCVAYTCVVSICVVSICVVSICVASANDVPVCVTPVCCAPTCSAQNNITKQHTQTLIHLQIHLLLPLILFIKTLFSVSHYFLQTIHATLAYSLFASA